MPTTQTEIGGIPCGLAPKGERGKLHPSKWNQSELDLLSEGPLALALEVEAVAEGRKP